MSRLRPLWFADEPTDDEDLRLRKRVGIVAGYATIVAPLTVPLQAPGSWPAWLLGVGLAVLSAANLVVLARSRRFTRYVRVLVTAGSLFVPLASVIGGGLTRANAIPWAFLAPSYAIMALGPREGRRWFVVFLVVVAVMAVSDPFVTAVVPAPAYPIRLFAQAAAVAPLTIAFLLLLYTDQRRRVAEARVDELLTNAIPALIARRLQRGESRIAERYPAASVLFADIVEFTPWAQTLDPDRLVAYLDDLFGRFDDVVAANGLEKIKTVGDAYMAVAGAPTPRSDHAAAALAAARGLLAAAAAWRGHHGVSLDIRVGVASGPLVGGVIGRRRLQFDVWGSTVNLASRMESSGVPGRVQIARSTYELLDAPTGFERRSLDVKGIGLVESFLSTG